MARDKAKTHPITSAAFLGSVPYRNEAAKVTARRGGSTLAEVPMRRPRWLVPPISWLLPYSARRRVVLDAVGAGVLKMCDGRDDVETIIEKFAADNKLSFREARLAVTQFLRQLTERGIIVIVGAEKKADE